MRAATTLIFIATAYTILSFFLLLQIFKNFGRDIHALGSLSLAPQNGVSDERVWYRQAAYAPSTSPSYAPSTSPSYAPSTSPSYAPSTSPSYAPSASPSYAPSTSPSYAPSTSPSYAPSTSPSRALTRSASASHSGAPSTASPSATGLSTGALALAGIFLVTGASLALAGVALWRRVCARRPMNPFLRKDGSGGAGFANPLARGAMVERTPLI